MRDTARALEHLRDALADVQHELMLLEQITRQLASVENRPAGTRLEPLIQRYLAEIDTRIENALARQNSVVRLLEETGMEMRRPDRFGLRLRALRPHRAARRGL